MRALLCALVFLVTGCTSLAPGQDLSRTFLEREVVVAAEQQPREIAVVSTSGDTATIQWNTMSSREQPFVALYGQSFDGGRLIVASSIHRDQELQGGYVTMCYTSSDDELHHKLVLSGLRYGCPTALGIMDYRLQIDNKSIPFTIDGNAGLEEEMSSGVHYTPPMPTGH